MIPTPEEYALSFKQQDVNTDTIIATVGGLSDNGRPLLIFPGEQSISRKVYPKARSYNDPRVGDRVVVINNIIMAAVD